MLDIITASTQLEDTRLSTETKEALRSALPTTLHVAGCGFDGFKTVDDLLRQWQSGGRCGFFALHTVSWRMIDEIQELLVEAGLIVIRPQRPPV